MGQHKAEITTLASKPFSQGEIWLDVEYSLHITSVLYMIMCVCLYIQFNFNFKIHILLGIKNISIFQFFNVIITNGN